MLHLLSLLEVQIFAFLLKLIIPLHGLSKPQMKATILDFEFVLCHLACSKGFLEGFDVRVWQHQYSLLCTVL